MCLTLKFLFYNLPEFLLNSNGYDFDYFYIDLKRRACNYLEIFPLVKAKDQGYVNSKDGYSEYRVVLEIISLSIIDLGVGKRVLVGRPASSFLINKLKKKSQQSPLSKEDQKHPRLLCILLLDLISLTISPVGTRHTVAQTKMTGEDRQGSPMS